MSKITVGVLRGGPSAEYDISLKTGAAVLRNLPERYAPVDILVGKDSVWYSKGVARFPDRILRQCDVVFNALHGFWGEDGKVQRILEEFHMPYTGSSAFASAASMNKRHSKEIFKNYALKVPQAVYVRRETTTPKTAVRIFQEFPQPSVIKPVNGGSSLGVSIARNFFEFSTALEEAFQFSEVVMIEEYVQGKEVTCGVVENFREEKFYALPPVEIVPPPNRFFDYEVKYDGSTRELCPAPSLSQEEKSAVADSARNAHRALGLRHYSRSDFIVSPRGIYLLEANTLPGLTDGSLLPKACEAVGCSFPQFLDHVITLAAPKLLA